MKRYSYNIEIWTLTFILAFSLSVISHSFITRGVVFIGVEQPEVLSIGRVGLPIEIEEYHVDPEPEVATEEPQMPAEEVKEPVEEKPVEKAKTSPEGTRVALTLSHYSDLAEENGGYAGLDAMGNKLVWGTLASNNFKKGTKIYIEHYEHTFTVSDVGSSKYLKKLSDGSIKVDVFVPRKSGESTKAYKQRVMNLGIVKTFGYVK